TGFQGFASGSELVRYETLEARVGDGRRDGVPVELLRAVQLVAAGHAPGMEVGDVVPVGADRADHVAFHDLHVVDVVQQLDARRIDRLHDGDAERRVVSLVIRVVHLAVQQLEAHRHTLRLGQRLDLVQAGHAVDDSLVFDV